MNYPVFCKIVGIMITALFCIPASPVLASQHIQDLSHPSQNYTLTGDQTNITVTVTQIRSLDKILKSPSFQVDVIIRGEHHLSPIWTNQPYVYDTWSVTQQVSTDDPWVNITIALWDTNTNKLCDLSPCHEGSDTYNDTVANLQYSLMTGHWVGDDWAFWWDEGHNGTDYVPFHEASEFDPSGYGHLNGCDDGSINQRDRDAELYFTITQTTPSADGIPAWLKTNLYHLDPAVDYTGYDPNHDGIPITWDWLWGYDPFTNDSHASEDLDNDGLNNTKELKVAQWGADPFHKDIYVELDHMANSSSGAQSILPVESKEMIRTCFAQHDIDLHIDDGAMGGSDVIPFKENNTRQDLSGYYYAYFLHGNLSNWRRGIFHYGIVLYNANYAGYNFWNGYLPYFDAFQISSSCLDKKIFPNTEHKRDIVYGSAYMHELGHNIGLNAFAGIDNQNSAFPWMKDWWKFLPYHSIMNYAYMYNMIGYSDGSHGKNDYDDWSHLDLTSFETEMPWHPHP